MRALSAMATPTLPAVLMTATSGRAQTPDGSGGRRGAGAEAKPAVSVPHDPRDLSGVWTRTSPLLTLSQTPPPFTPLGKKLFDANKPSYGPRAVPPAVGNDPTGTADRWGRFATFCLARLGLPDGDVQSRMGVQFSNGRTVPREVWMTAGRCERRRTDFNGISTVRGKPPRSCHLRSLLTAPARPLRGASSPRALEERYRRWNPKAVTEHDVDRYEAFHGTVV